MKTVLATIAILTTAACGGAGGSVSTMTGGGLAAPQIAISQVPSQTFESMLNGVRSANGAGAVTYDARLGAAARRHANDMHENNFFSHTGSDGSTAGTRVSEAGYRWRTYGENIARGQVDEAAVLQAWVNSPGHQSNNVNPNFEDFALAKAGVGSRQYWVLVLAAER